MIINVCSSSKITKSVNPTDNLGLNRLATGKRLGEISYDSFLFLRHYGREHKIWEIHLSEKTF